MHRNFEWKNQCFFDRFLGFAGRPLREAEFTPLFSTFGLKVSLSSGFLLAAPGGSVLRMMWVSHYHHWRPRSGAIDPWERIFAFLGFFVPFLALCLKFHWRPRSERSGASHAEHSGGALV